MFLFFLIAILSFLFQLFLPWWSLAIVAFGCAFFLGRKSVKSFSAGFLASGIVWLLMALFIHFTKGDLMTNRISQLLSLPSSWLLYLITFLIAGIIGGLAAVSGFYLKSIVSDRRISSAS
ncbi:MAG: hypothetical protein ACHQD9_07565 [Chitinophagales bacterium]